VNRLHRALLWGAILSGALAATAYFGLPFLLRTAEQDPPLNTVMIHAQLATSGQPSEAQLRRLANEGYQAVINLAPPDAYGSVSNEAEIARETGMAYFSIPVDWKQPSPDDFARFRAAMDELRGRQIWVHCQLNLRASVFVFLWRVIDERIGPDQAISGVHAVWVPNATWRQFALAMLAHQGVVIDPAVLQ